MKKTFLLLSLIFVELFLTGCIADNTIVEEPGFLYKVEVNIHNESSSEKTISTETYSLCENDCHKLADDDSEKTIIASKMFERYEHIISFDLCPPPHLSHIFKIDGKNFAGFNPEKYTSFRDIHTGKKIEKIAAVKTDIGSVDWSQDEKLIINYEGKTFYENADSIIKLIYTIIIKDEADIADSEKSEYTEGAKISITHMVEKD